LVADEDRVGTRRLRTPPTLPRTVVTHISREVSSCCELLKDWRSMSNESRRLAGILLIVLPTVMYGGGRTIN
jgi:hypothetical protein